MPNIICPVKESFLTVNRPVVRSIINDLCDLINIPQSVKVFFPDAIEEDAQIGSKLGVNEDVGTFSGNNKVSVTVNESYNIDLINTAPVVKPESKFVFQDTALDIYIKPAYKYTDLIISFTYRSVDKAGAERWRDDIIAKHSMMRDMFVHRVSYYYNIPNLIIEAIREIHKLRENIEPYGDTFEDYFWKNMTQRATETTNLNGTQFVAGVTETQDEIIGHFDIDGMPDQITRDGDQGTFSVTIPYKLTYSKPIECVARFPNIIHNQILSTKYWNSTQFKDTNQYLNHYSFSSEALFKMRQQRVYCQPNTLSGIPIPHWDEFITPYLAVKSIRIFTAATIRTPLDKKLLLNLTDLGDFELDPKIITFMKQYYTTVKNPNQNPFIVSVYKNYRMLTPSEFTIDSDLNISLVDDGSLRDIYRVRLGLVVDLLALADTGIEVVKKNADIFNLIIETLKPGIGTIKPILDKYVDKKDYENKASEINQKTSNRSNWGMVTVMNLIIRSRGSK